jgi:hypothetical protein
MSTVENLTQDAFAQALDEPDRIAAAVPATADLAEAR